MKALTLLLVPFVGAVRHTHSLAEQAIAVPGEPCRTRDERQVWIAGLVTATVTDARKASYETADYRAAADAWGIAVIRYEMTDISRHNKESAA